MATPKWRLKQNPLEVSNLLEREHRPRSLSRRGRDNRSALTRPRIYLHESDASLGTGTRIWIAVLSTIDETVLNAEANLCVDSVSLLRPRKWRAIPSESCCLKAHPLPVYYHLSVSRVPPINGLCFDARGKAYRSKDARITEGVRLRGFSIAVEPWLLWISPS